MKFDPCVHYEKVVENKITIVYRGNDSRFYVADTDTPSEWHSSHPSFTSAMESLKHTREFWEKKMAPAIRDDKRTVRVEGTHYMVGDEKANPRGFRGFGGALFLIEFDDGRRVSSTNLWCQGTIPKALSLDLPDNAKFHDTTEAFAAYHNEDDTNPRMWLDRWMEDTHAQA